ncbi:hypothetical protein IFM89_010724 [Coptis chinensis]|uniref:AAA+ ATPase domain-containing protein n=1 Tax=Coptis chinensis TaxID=261450 RepID=A0A835IMN7_9MAGN|nr:hypothetical protein IFM89_010724 [Coptis chinensis]
MLVNQVKYLLSKRSSYPIIFSLQNSLHLICHSCRRQFDKSSKGLSFSSLQFIDFSGHWHQLHSRRPKNIKATRNMFSTTKMPSTSSLFSAYTSVATFFMLIRAIATEAKSILTQFIPEELQRKILSIFERFYKKPPSVLTLVINEYNAHMGNELYEASEVYLSTKAASPSLDRLIVSKQQRDKKVTVTVEKDQDIVDVFEHIQLTWKLVSLEKESGHREVKFFELCFDKQYKQIVMDSYLPYVLKRFKSIKEDNRVLKLHSLGFYGDGDGDVWGSIKLDHPSTFDTLAMDSKMKKELLEDLDRFVKRREFYRRVGKPWKRGYLLYGPPGTGKSSLIAAMANYLNFNVYDMELSSIYSNSELRRLLIATANRSILVIEDIDCSVELQDRTTSEETRYEGNNQNSQLTLSGLLNFIDGLWSSCGDERIIIFTTNHKDRLDPALLRPGRMDMHIHMSYCTPSGFKLLASNYLQIKNDPLFEEIELLINYVNVTPAEVAEELMKSDDTKASLKGLINFLERKKAECDKSNDNNVEDRGRAESLKAESEHENEVEKNSTCAKESEITLSADCEND